jgi:hypothetical protein
MTPPTSPPPAHGHDAPLDDGVHHDALDGPLHNVDVAHEHSDINVRAILMFLVGLALVTAVAAAAMGGVFKILERMAAKNDPPLSPLAAPASDIPLETTKSPEFGTAPRPRLLTNEFLFLEGIRAAEAKRLETGAWVDETGGIGRMPIAEAKKVLLHKGLPVRAGDPADPRMGTHAASMADASSGRLATAQQPARPSGSQPPAQETPKPPDQKPGGGGH